MRHRATDVTGWTPEQLFRVRGWLYRVATAAALLLAGYGIIAADRLPLWIALAGALFATGTAAANTPTRKPAGPANRIYSMTDYSSAGPT